MLADTDRRILRHLMADPAASGSVLGERAGVSASVLSRRMEKLRQDGILRGIHAEINWPALGYEVEVSLRVTLDKTEPNAFDRFVEAARDVPEVTEIQTFLGRVDVRLVVIAQGMEHYQAIYRDRILTLPHIADIEALMQVAAIKTSTGVPI